MKRFSRSILVRIAVLLFSLFCIVTIINLQFEKNSIEDEISSLNVKLQEAMEERDDLERQLNESFDEEYIIKVAKEKLGLRLPQEIIFYNGD